MSHFLVMVIGNDPEKQLAPYHEFECTGQDDEYIQEIDQTEEVKEEFVAYKERKAKERKEKVLAGDGGPEQEEEMSFTDYVVDYCGNKIVKFGKRPSKKKTHKYGYALTNEAGEIIKIVRRTNADKSLFRDNGNNIFAYSSKGENLQFLQANSTDRAVLCNEASGLVPFVQGLHKAQKQNEQNDGAEKKVEHQSQIWSFPTRFLKNVGYAERFVRYLQDNIGNEEWRIFCRSLSFDTEGEKPSMRQLQSLAGICERQGINFEGCNSLSGQIQSIIVGGAKWDWYMLGGRYSGRLTLKEGAVGERGEPSFMGPPPGIDRAAKGDIDLDTMRIDAAEEAGKDYDVFAKATKGHPWPEEWKVVLERYGTERIEEARAFYGEQPLVKAMRKCRDIYPLSSPEDYGQDRSAYIQRKVNKCGVPFAFIKDGKWYEKGEMGWFACVSNEKDENIWNEEFWKMFNALPDNTMISMYDCHI